MTDPFDPLDAPFGEPSTPLFDAPEEMVAEVSVSPRQLDGRLAVVTGAAGMLGAAICAELSYRGAAVCMVGRDLDALDATARTLGPGALSAPLCCDLAIADEIADAVRFVERLDRPVDLLVHAAGLQAPGRVTDSPVDALDEHYLLNVRGPYVLSQLVAPLMSSPGGQCVFVTSAPRSDRREGDAHHTITQAAARALADQLRLEITGSGVRVLTVTADDWTDVPRSAVDPDEFAAGLAGGVVDAVVQTELDVTELSVRGIARPVRTERL